MWFQLGTLWDATNTSQMRDGSSAVHMPIGVMVVEGTAGKVLGEISDTPGMHGTGPVR
jgi:hypothetical protein